MCMHLDEYTHVQILTVARVFGWQQLTDLFVASEIEMFDVKA